MGSQFVDGSAGWGSILGNVVSGLESAPGKALSNIHAAEVIKDQRIKRAREEEDYQLRNAASGLLDAAVPAAQAAPTTTVGPFVGDINDPAVTAGLPKATFIDPREQAAAEARRAYLVATGKADTLAKPGQGPASLSYATVGATGVPEDARKRAELEFYSTGKFPTHIGADDSKNPIKQWVPVNDKNEPIGQAVASRVSPGPSYVLANPISLNQRDDTKVTIKNWVEIDPVTRQPTGRRISQADKPEGDNWLLGGVADASAVSPMDDKNKARVALAKLDDERITNGGLRTPVQAMEAARLFEIAYPRSRIDTDEAGRKITKNVRAEPIPDNLKQLHQIADDVAKGRHLAPPDAPRSPYVDPNADEVLYKGPAQAAELRKEYQNTQAVSDWIITAPLYNSAIKSAQAPTNQGDINIMYAFAKLMDPGSVVRDSEGKLVMNSGTIPQSIVGTFNRLIQGGGTMDAQVRLNLIDTLKNRMDEIKSSRDITDKFYREQVAPKAGLAPEEVLVPLVEPLVYDRDMILRSGGAATTAAPPPRRGADAVLGR
jgi:hypothetical protein